MTPLEDGGRCSPAGAPVTLGGITTTEKGLVIEA
jgi:hypothetical protein